MFAPAATLSGRTAQVGSLRPHSARPSSSRPRRGSVVVRAEEENPIAGNPLFNEQFMGVLQQSLARQGADSLTTGLDVEEREHATVEVLTTAVQQSKQTLQVLLMWRDQIEKQVKAQQKQIDRMEFALNKSRQDAAYLKVMKEMMHDS